MAAGGMRKANPQWSLGALLPTQPPSTCQSVIQQTFLGISSVPGSDFMELLTPVDSIIEQTLGERSGGWSGCCGNPRVGGLEPAGVLERGGKPSSFLHFESCYLSASHTHVTMT